MKARILLAAIAVAALSLPASADTVRVWSWLNGTTWYVPNDGLLAYNQTLDTNALTPMLDQTVYTITGYRNGYFWGYMATTLGENPVDCKSLVGSVTPEGKVYLNFTTFPYDDGAETMVGLGTMEFKVKQWTMANQMAISSSTYEVGHWAYMLQARPGSPAWRSLPGVNVSVPVFMDTCKAAAPTTPTG